MTANRKRKPKSGLKFLLRRLILSVIILMAAASAIWFAAQRLGDMPRENTDTPDMQSSENPEPQPPSQSVAEPEISQSPEEPAPIPVSDDDAWQLVLLSASSPLSDDFTVPELELISGDYKVDARAAPFLRRMIADAKLEGIALMITSAYRSPEYQQTLFDRQIEQQRRWHPTEEEAVAAAAMVVLPPGTSEHHTGLAVDIVTPDYQQLDEGFAETSAAKWMAENAWKYGFILRYPKDKQDITKIIYEPWHFRFVGEVHAKAIKENAYCLEEYLVRTAFADIPESAMVSADEPEPDKEQEETP